MHIFRFEIPQDSEMLPAGLGIIFVDETPYGRVAIVRPAATRSDASFPIAFRLDVDVNDHDSVVMYFYGKPIKGKLISDFAIVEPESANLEDLRQDLRAIGVPTETIAKLKVW